MLNSIMNVSCYNDIEVGIYIGVIVAIVLITIIGILSEIFLGLAVYNDAKAKADSNPGMWGVLTGLFGWIPAVIYLCVRNNSSQKLISCTYCGFLIPKNAPGCPSCNNANPYAQQLFGPEVESSKKRAKGFLIAAICMYAAVILIIVAFVIIVSILAGIVYY